MKTQTMIKTFELFIAQAQEAISTLQVKVGKDADEQARITIKIANLYSAMKYCKVVMVKNNHTPTGEKALVAFNSVSHKTEDLESAPVLNDMDDVYAAYITFRRLLAETDGFMYRVWIKTGTIVYVALHYVNKYTFRLVFNGMVWLWDKVKGFFAKTPEAEPVPEAIVEASETVPTIEATPVAEPVSEAIVEASEVLLDVSDDIIEELESESNEDTTKKSFWRLRSDELNFDLEAIAKAFYAEEGDNEELFSSIFGITPEYVAKIFSAIRPAKKEIGGSKPTTGKSANGNKPSKKHKKS